MSEWNRKYIEWINVSEKQHDQILALAKGSFQVGLLSGRDSYSLATLRGNAKKYSYQYHMSKVNLMNRIRHAGYVVDIVTREHGLKVIQIINPDVHYMLANF